VQAEDGSAGGQAARDAAERDFSGSEAGFVWVVAGAGLYGIGTEFDGMVDHPREGDFSQTERRPGVGWVAGREAPVAGLVVEKCKLASDGAGGVLDAEKRHLAELAEGAREVVIEGQRARPIAEVTGFSGGGPLGLVEIVELGKRLLEGIRRSGGVFAAIVVGGEFSPVRLALAAEFGGQGFPESFGRIWQVEEREGRGRLGRVVESGRGQSVLPIGWGGQIGAERAEADEVVAMICEKMFVEVVQ